jgi:hypothetical protein
LPWKKILLKYLFKREIFQGGHWAVHGRS